MDITPTESGWTVTTRSYTLFVPTAGWSARLSAPDGQVLTELSLIAHAEAWLGTDIDSSLRPPAGRRFEPHGPDGPAFITGQPGTPWWSAETVLRPAEDSVALTLRVATVFSTALSDVTLGGGRAVKASGAGGEFRSRICHGSVFAPCPSEPVQWVRPAHAASRLGVIGDAEPGRWNALFSPPPLTWAFGPAAPAAGSPTGGLWLAVTVDAPVDQLAFTCATYEPLDGGWLIRLAYEGHTEVTGSWTSPALVLRPVPDQWAALDAQAARPSAAARTHTRPRAVSPTPPATSPATPAASSTAPAADTPAWWREPLFCGWGAQCAEAKRRGVPAATLARQDLYDGWLAHLAAHGVRPGTVVIDDKWQSEYGTLMPDRAKWPDLRAWIAGRHADGQRVLLWFKAWDPEGLPADECVLDHHGDPVAADPANPAYRAHLDAVVTALLSPGGLDADGFKVDFTQRAPSGNRLRPAGTWGIALLHELLATLHCAAAAAKPDALLVTHTVHPAFADVTGMVRLNDLAEHDPTGRPVPAADQLRARAEIVRHTLPGKLIDTDQWPMPSRADWLAYSELQPHYGVPSLYYADGIDTTGEPLTGDDLRQVAAWWEAYRRAAE